MISSICNWLFGNSVSTDNLEPSVNINGLPMVGALDIHGNTYGTTMNDSLFSGHDSSSSFSAMSPSSDSWSSGGSDWSSSNGSSWD